MTDLALENNIFMLNERNEHERTKIKRILKSQWLSDYAPDIFQTMKESESHRRPVFFTSTELNKRPILIQLCHVISRTYKLGHCAQHLGVFYMDRYLDYNTVESEKLQLIALTCMHIAAQIENTDINVPRYSEMNRLIKGSYTSSDFKDAERKVLKFFDFKLIHPTVASFVEMFAWNFITNDDYISYCKSLDELDKATAEANAINYPRYTSFEQMLAKLALVLMRMSDYTLNINNFINKPPSLLAASCIAATRKVSGLPKRWTPLLTELTSYDEQAVEPFVNAITECHYIQELSNLKLQEQQQQQQQQLQLQQEQQFQLQQQPQLQVQQQPQLQVQQQVQQPLQELNWNSPDSGFGDSLTPSQLEIVSLELQATAPEMEVVSVEVETFSVITVKLQAPRTGTLKRNLDNNNNEEDEMQTKRLKLDEDQLYP